MKKSVCCLLLILLALLALAPCAAFGEMFSEEDILAEEGGEIDNLLFGGDTEGMSFDFENEGDLGEEEGEVILQPQPGGYEWYMIPTLPLQGCGYIDIYPQESPLYPAHSASSPSGVAWNYAFVMTNTSAYDFTPSFINIIPFWDNGAFSTSRDQWTTYYSEDLPALMGGRTIPAGQTVVFQARNTDARLCAIALSMTGKDANGKEMEFHGMVLLEAEIRDPK